MKYDSKLDGNREALLLRFYNEWIIPKFKALGYDLPENVKISIGLQQHKQAIGSTYHPIVGGGFYHIFITPKIAKDVYAVFATLIHEAIHTLYFNHKKDFSTAAKAIGLLKPWKATTASVKLDNDITDWLTAHDLFWYEPKLIDLPKGFKAPSPDDGGSFFGGGGGAIGAPPRQASRMVKLECPSCNYIIRTARTNIKTKGLPICPCGDTFEEN